ncbi:MAG: hypothetical protein A2166_06365 [Omnitrophica WOR_2 bacterium RBG_13_41_10]|nr:MAG: hypothetical protein A2166_06365 [Omnitrophica WOR_2 bacterium RBG_13_41_10]
MSDMPRGILNLILVFLLVLMFSTSSARAQAPDEEIAVLKAQVQGLLKRIEALEQEQAKAKEMSVKQGEVKKAVPEEPAVVTSTMPVKGIKLGGKLEIRYQDFEGEEGTFSLTNFEPNIVVDVNDNISMKGQLECTPTSVIANEGWIQYKKPPVIQGALKAGRFRRKSFGLPQGDSDRVSLDYALLGRAFTGERQLGLEYTNSFKKMGLLGPVNLGIGVFNGADLGNRETGDNAKRQVLFLADRAGDTSDTQQKEFSLRSTIAPIKELQMGGSVSVGKLSSADISTLNTYLGTSRTDDKKQRFGADITYKFNNVPLELRGEYMHGKTSDLGIDVWYTMGILKLLNKKLDLYARYGQLNLDIGPTFNSYTWDLEQATLGAIWYFNKMNQIQIEYEFNGEDTKGAAGEVDNDILRMEWQTLF